MAQIAGVCPRTLPNNPDGTIDVNLIEKSIRADNVHFTSTELIALEVLLYHDNYSYSIILLITTTTTTTTSTSTTSYHYYYYYYYYYRINELLLLLLLLLFFFFFFLFLFLFFRTLIIIVAAECCLPDISLASPSSLKPTIYPFI